MKTELVNMRHGKDSIREKHLINHFASSFKECIGLIQFGKQDIRGNYSISIFEKKYPYCIIEQKIFNTRLELFAYMEGYLALKYNHFNNDKKMEVVNNE